LARVGADLSARSIGGIEARNMRTPQKRYRVSTPALGAVILFFFVCLAAQHATAATPSPGTHSVLSNSNFAIADFDGDRQPDLATVDLDGFEASYAHYSIRFRLAAGGGQSLGVAAPFGGLYIAARDVNGDNALDLVITTAWLHEPVAVLLNDGHGQFTFSRSPAPPATLRDSDAGWGPQSGPCHESSALFRAGPAAGEGSESEGISLLPYFPSRPTPMDFPALAGPVLLAPLSRAPPQQRFRT
jgi:hypothetical protein